MTLTISFDSTDEAKAWLKHMSKFKGAAQVTTQHDAPAAPSASSPATAEEKLRDYQRKRSA
jgi:hypothetical protein